MVAEPGRWSTSSVVNFHVGSVGVSSRIFAVYSASTADGAAGVGACALAAIGAASSEASEATSVAWRMTSAWVRGQTRRRSASERKAGKIRDLTDDAVLLRHDG